MRDNSVKLLLLPIFFIATALTSIGCMMEARIVSLPAEPILQKKVSGPNSSSISSSQNAESNDGVYKVSSEIGQTVLLNGKTASGYQLTISSVVEGDSIQ